MKKDDKVYLRHILDAMGLIEEYIGGLPGAIALG